MPFLSVASSLEYAILNEANQRHSGFIIAFQTPDHLGFSFLARQDDFVVVLHGVSMERGVFKLEASSCRNPSGVTDISFVSNYLEKAARRMNLVASELIRAIRREKYFLWRFVGFVDGQLSDAADNNMKWRQLWKRIQSEVIVPGCVPHASGASKMPRTHTAELERQLGNCATEGQIVLDR